MLIRSARLCLLTFGDFGENLSLAAADVAAVPRVDADDVARIDDKRDIEIHVPLFVNPGYIIRIDSPHPRPTVRIQRLVLPELL